MQPCGVEHHDHNSFFSSALYTVYMMVEGPLANE
jgi:hypothetical protein